LVGTRDGSNNEYNGHRQGGNSVTTHSGEASVALVKFD